MTSAAQTSAETPDLLHTIGLDSWQGPVDPAVYTAAGEALEEGRILYLPRLGFALEPAEAALLARDWSGEAAKNVSYDPASGRVKGATCDEGSLALLRNLMARYADDSAALLSALLPHYVGALQRARTSFRPVEVHGRATSPRKDDRRLHVDAFPSQPTRGRRILRVFSNVNPEGRPRHWRVGEPFEAAARTLLPRVSSPLPGLAWLYEKCGVTKGRRSRYDHVMLQMHDRAKADSAYQAERVAAEIDFPTGSTWIVFTDQVMHAATAGQHLLEQTFHLPVEALQSPERSPLRVLERLGGRTLVP